MQKKISLLFLSFCLLFIFSCSQKQTYTIPEEQANQILSDAQDSFDSGLKLLIDQTGSPTSKFSQTTDYYNQLIEAGYVNAQIFFNTGNCYRFLREDALALLYYKKALLLDEKKIYRDAVHSILESNGYREQVGFFTRLTEWIDHIVLSTSILIKVIIIGCILMLMLIMLIIDCFIKKFAGKNVILAIAGIMIALILLFGGWQLFIPGSGEQGVVLQDIMPKSGDSFAYDDATNSPLYPAQLFDFIESRKGWFYIELPNGVRCWIPENSCQLISDPYLN